MVKEFCGHNHIVQRKCTHTQRHILQWAWVENKTRLFIIQLCQSSKGRYVSFYLSLFTITNFDSYLFCTHWSRSSSTTSKHLKYSHERYYNTMQTLGLQCPWYPKVLFGYFLLVFKHPINHCARFLGDYYSTHTPLGQELVLRGSSTSSFSVGLLIISDLLRPPYNTIIFFPVTHFYHRCDNALCPLSSLSKSRGLLACQVQSSSNWKKLITGGSPSVWKPAREATDLSQQWSGRK